MKVPHQPYGVINSALFIVHQYTPGVYRRVCRRMQMSGFAVQVTAVPRLF